jgi:hypothetical protein
VRLSDLGQVCLVKERLTKMLVLVRVEQSL